MFVYVRCYIDIFDHNIWYSTIRDKLWTCACCNSNQPNNTSNPRYRISIDEFLWCGRTGSTVSIYITLLHQWMRIPAIELLWLSLLTFMNDSVSGVCLSPVPLLECPLPIIMVVVTGDMSEIQWQLLGGETRTELLLLRLEDDVAAGSKGTLAEALICSRLLQTVSTMTEHNKWPWLSHTRDPGSPPTWMRTRQRIGCRGYCWHWLLQMLQRGDSRPLPEWTNWDAALCRRGFCGVQNSPALIEWVVAVKTLSTYLIRRLFQPLFLVTVREGRRVAHFLVAYNGSSDQMK